FSEFCNAFFAFGVTGHNRAQISDRFFAIRTAGGSKSQHFVDCVIRKLSTLGEVTAFIQTAFAQQKTHTFKAKLVQLVYGAQNIEPLSSIGLVFKADRVQNPVQNLAVINPNDIVAALD